MNEQKDEFEFDVEGHRQLSAEGAEDDTVGHRYRPAEGADEDTEGHRYLSTRDDEDVEGHRIKGSHLIEDDEDVEGHRLAVQPPRDTDLGGTDH